MPEAREIAITRELAGQTLGGALRRVLPELSWSAAKRMIVARRVQVNGTLCLNDARRLKAGETITILQESLAPLPSENKVKLLHIDPHLVVVDKPAGVVTIRHREEAEFSERRKELQPTLQELVQRLLPGGQKRSPSKRGKANVKSPLHAVHRLDRDTSGLMLFALSPAGRDRLIEMFKRHDVRRNYLAVVHGCLREDRTIDTWIVRDRGDGLRGSLPGGQSAEDAERAITHIHPIRQIGSYTIVQCRLETGRTHQIRIHMAEIGHMLCGEKLYLRPAAGADAVDDTSGAPRQALHSMELDFAHPFTGQAMHFESTLPPDLAKWLATLG